MAILPRKPKVKVVKVYRKCVICSADVFKYNSQSCSKECSNKLHSIKNIRERKNDKICEHCKKEYYAINRSKKQKFCSYNCFVKNGGTVRAGNANVERMKKYGAKKDNNHNEIAKYLEDKGCFVKDLSGAGFGVPDIVVWIKDRWLFAEIKNPKTRYGKNGLNDKQKEWADNWKGGCVYIIKTVEDCDNLIIGDYDKVDYFPKY